MCYVIALPAGLFHSNDSQPRFTFIQILALMKAAGKSEVKGLLSAAVVATYSHFPWGFTIAIHLALKCICIYIYYTYFFPEEIQFLTNIKLLPVCSPVSSPAPSYLLIQGEIKQQDGTESRTGSCQWTCLVGRTGLWRAGEQDGRLVWSQSLSLFDT